MLQLDDLDVARTMAPSMADDVTSTNVFAQVEATVCGAGVGLLPTFVADRRPHYNGCYPTHSNTRWTTGSSRA